MWVSERCVSWKGVRSAFTQEPDPQCAVSEHDTCHRQKDPASKECHDMLSSLTPHNCAGRGAARGWPDPHPSEGSPGQTSPLDPPY